MLLRVIAWVVGVPLTMLGPFLLFGGVYAMSEDPYGGGYIVGASIWAFVLGLPPIRWAIKNGRAERRKVQVREEYRARHGPGGD